MDGSTPPLTSACRNYAEHYANRPAIKRVFAASSEMETMIRQMLGSCMSGADKYTEDSRRSAPGPRTGMVIQANNSNHENLRRYGHHIDEDDQIGKGDNGKMDDDMSAITALTLEEMEKISDHRRRHITTQSNPHRITYEDKIQFEPSSRFEPNFDAFNIGEESILDCDNHNIRRPIQMQLESSGQHNFFPQTTPRQSQQLDYRHMHSNQAMSRNDPRLQVRPNVPRVVTPPKAMGQGVTVDSQSSRSSGSRSARSRALHPHDYEMQSSDKIYVKSRLNSLQHMVNDSHSSGHSRYNKNTSVVSSHGSNRIRRNERKNTRPNSSLSDTLRDESHNSKVHKMQMFDGSYLEFTDDDRYGEI